MLTAIRSGGFADGFTMLAYVDRTSDVQTAAVIAAHAVPRRFKDRRADAWIDSYVLSLHMQINCDR